ncbi:MAG: T9SS type A sorting domain-containing protein [Bacteroidota bacterium]|nr:T9SS type A sorting domain-containing protein [Bacteroidota bacterium]
MLAIYDISGKKVKEQSLNQQNTIIDLSGLSGIYIVQLGDKNGSNIVRKKLVIQE